MSPNHILYPIPMIEERGDKLTGIRSQLPPRASDLANTENMLLPNAKGLPEFSPNLPVARQPVGGVKQETTNNALGVPVIDVPSADVALMLKPSAQYHPAALNAMGVGGGSSNQDLLGMQVAQQISGKNVPGVPPLVRKILYSLRCFLLVLFFRMFLGLTLQIWVRMCQIFIILKCQVNT